MSSDREARRLAAERGSLGKRAQLREFERQLRWLSKWLESKKREAQRRSINLKRKIAGLQAGVPDRARNPTPMDPSGDGSFRGPDGAR